ncbi:hypothetical protein [Candidatus Erwinia haradaeae]|uniref:hypothetical protein n=1 Tax=Candidatus Erwinia haradaeae TaxID=1922217 RepID=UPI0013003E79|nr:hypothetical protein [Candidatus Erwinia haradaeae]
MSSIIAKEILGISDSHVALMNIETEINKGLKSIQDADHTLRKSIKINFIGHVEVNELLSNKTDVLICSEFIGNIT